MSNIRSIVDMSQALRWVEQHETVSETVDAMYQHNNMKWIVILFNDPEKWIEMPRRTHERYFGMLREAGKAEAESRANGGRRLSSRNKRAHVQTST